MSTNIYQPNFVLNTIHKHKISTRMILLRYRDREAEKLHCLLLNASYLRLMDLVFFNARLVRRKVTTISHVGKETSTY